MSDNKDQTLAECRDLVARLRLAQDNSGLKSGHFVSRFRNERNACLLGSARTWDCIREDDWTRNNPSRLLPRLRQCISQLDGGSLRQEVFPDLPFYKLASSLLVTLEGQTNDRRCLLILAPTGVGKTFFLRESAAKAGRNRFYLRCSPPLRDRGPAITAHLYRAIVGEELKVSSYDEALKRLTARLSAAPCTVLIDEAHDGGIELMKILRYLIDETPSRFVIAAYPTDYTRVINASSGALSEARQFVGRCLKPIFDDYRDGTKPGDVARILKGAGYPDDKEFTARVFTLINNREGLRTLSDAIEEAERSSAEAARDPDREPVRADLVAALEFICGQKLAPKQEGQ